MLRFLVATTIITIIALLSFNILTTPLQYKLADNYIDLAKQDIGNANWEGALKDLNSAEVYTDTEAGISQITQLRDDISKAQADLFAEKKLLSTYGNTAKVALLNRVLEDYKTPKEMLEVVLVLYQNGESRYAEILLNRAEMVNPNYIGVTSMRDYFSKDNDV